MIPRRSPTLDLRVQTLFVWAPDREPVVDGVVLEEWESHQFYVPGGAPFTFMCDLPATDELRPVVASVLRGWADDATVLRARVARGRDRVRLSDGDTELTLDLRSAVVEAHPAG